MVKDGKKKKPQEMEVETNRHCFPEWAAMIVAPRLLEGKRREPAGSPKGDTLE